MRTVSGSHCAGTHETTDYDCARVMLGIHASLRAATEHCNWSQAAPLRTREYLTGWITLIPSRAPCAM